MNLVTKNLTSTTFFPERLVTLHLSGLNDQWYSGSNLLNNSEIVKFDALVDFEPNTYFSLTELLHTDDNSQFEEANASGDLGYLKNSCRLGVPGDCGTVNLASNCGSTNSLQGNVNNCRLCSQKELAPDLSCQICGIRIHSHCSPWVESPSRLGSWRCGDCREWR